MMMPINTMALIMLKCGDVPSSVSIQATTVKPISTRAHPAKSLLFIVQIYKWVFISITERWEIYCMRNRETVEGD